MLILEGLSGLRQLPPGAVVSIGNFDGVHRGHGEILHTARRLAEGHSGIAVVTFEPHPLTVLRPQVAPPRLTSLQLKRELLQNAGVNWLVELPPTPQVLDLAAEQFWHILRDEVRPGPPRRRKLVLFWQGSWRIGRKTAGMVREHGGWFPCR